MRIAAGILACLLAVSAHAVPAKQSVAPVVKPVKGGELLKQTGWFKYDTMEDAVVLYCIHTSDTLLTCAVFVFDKGVVLIPNIRATELKS